MQTQLTDTVLQTDTGKEAEKILRSCVHCGFCNATCPTYQLLGDELDGPRGRIYQIKAMLEGKQPTQETQTHLDRCLTCRACETTCPSGVQYGKLLDIGRHMLEEKVERPFTIRLKRRMIMAILPYPNIYRWVFQFAQWLRPVLPAKIQKKLPKKYPIKPTVRITSSRKVILVQGCAQSALAAQINQATATVLAHLNIEVLTPNKEGCCGAIHHHLGNATQRFIKQNIDAWWPLIEQGAEAIISTASGCGVHLKDYGHLLPKNDPYLSKANTVAERVQDIGEFLSQQDLSTLIPHKNHLGGKIAFHDPCTLQHGQRASNHVKSLLRQCGFELTSTPDAHLCCGSAGTYSILQPQLSRQLRDNKISALQTDQPHTIATANIGCLLHLTQGTDTPVKHWIELICP